MPTGDDYLLDAGADLTPTFGAHAAQITQAIELAVPNSYRGAVIVSETTPTTSGQPSGYPTGWYAWQKRCLWYKVSTKELFAFDGTTWAPVKATPANGSVGTAQLADGSVTIAKLSPTGGDPYQVQRNDSGGTALEWIDAVELFGPNEIAISKLADSSVGYFVLTRNGPTKAWVAFDSATLLALLGSDQIPVDYLAHGSALQVPMMNAGATAVTWAAVLSGIADYTVPIAKISKSVPDAGKWLRIQADGAVLPETLTIPTPTGTTFASASEVAAGTEAAKAIAPATVGSIAGLVKAKLVASISTNVGGVTAATLVEGANIASVAVVGNRMRVTFTTALATADYAIVAYCDNTNITLASAVGAIANKAVGSFDIGGYSSGASGPAEVSIIIL